MADTVTTTVPGPADTVAATPLFSHGEEVNFEVDGQIVDAVIKAVTPVGGGTASYTVERTHVGTTGFKPEKYVAESRITPKVPAVSAEETTADTDSTKKTRKNKKTTTPETTPVVALEVETPAEDATEPVEETTTPVASNTDTTTATVTDTTTSTKVGDTASSSTTPLAGQ